MRDCREALAMVDTTQERKLVKMIRGKFQGEARKTIYGRSFDTLDELHAFLKRVYSSSKTAMESQGETAHCFQRLKEKVLTYANRIRDVGRRIVDTFEHKTNANNATLAAFRTSVEAATIRCFIRGLHEDIERKTTTTQEFSTTVENAIRAENVITTKKWLRGET